MRRNLKELSDSHFDLVVVGCGIYGAFIAWDAALRGLSVAVLEKGDFGHATSSNTLRVIHGGFRYLQHADIARVRRSIRERAVFMHIAPHLVHPLPFLIPTYGHRTRGREVLAAALLLNDLAGVACRNGRDPERTLPRGRIISKEECRRIAPGLDENGLTGGAILYDAQMSDSERLLLGVVRSASSSGAEFANYVQATGLLRKGDTVRGVKAHDVLTGTPLEIQARLVINACGPWTTTMLGATCGHGPQRSLTFSKAFNLLINRQLIPGHAIGVYGKRRFADSDAILSKGARLFFITPWRDRSLIGTAHLPCAANPESSGVSDAELIGFIDEINGAFPPARVGLQDVSAVFSGLLPAAPSGNPDGDVQLVKRHRIVDHETEHGVRGVVSVVGVKFTEARYVAEKVVDLAARRIDKEVGPSMTSKAHVHGGRIERLGDFVGQEAGCHQDRGLSRAPLEDIIRRYGSEYRRVLRYLDDRPALPRRCDGGENSAAGPPPLLQAEILHAIREEMALKLTDVVLRRTSLRWTAPLGIVDLKACALLMARELHWTHQRINREISDTAAALTGPAALTTQPV